MNFGIGGGVESVEISELAHAGMHYSACVSGMMYCVCDEFVVWVAVEVLSAMHPFQLSGAKESR